LAPDLKECVVSIVFPNIQPTHPQGPPSYVSFVTIDLHMEIIQVHVGKNILKDVLLDGGSSVNIIIEDLKKKLGLLLPKPAPYTRRMANQTLIKLVRLI
jgi:hypothetical protein